MRKSGKVKWYDTTKGYGFIVTNDGLEVLLHRSVLGPAQLAIIADGSTVEFECAERTSGRLVVTCVYSVSEPPRISQASGTGQAPSQPLRSSGLVKWFSRPKGFGFIRDQNSGEDVFVHMDVLRKMRLRELRAGSRVEYEIESGAKGPTATRLFEVSVPRTLEDLEALIMPKPGEIVEGVVGRLIWFSEDKNKGAIALPGFDDLAEVDLSILRDAGIFSPHSCGKLICDVEWLPPRFYVRRVRQVN